MVVGVNGRIPTYLKYFGYHTGVGGVHMDRRSSTGNRKRGPQHSPATLWLGPWPLPKVGKEDRRRSADMGGATWARSFMVSSPATSQLRQVRGISWASCPRERRPF